MGSDTTLYLPDGQLLIPPEDPRTWSEGDVVTAHVLTHDVGQVGVWYAQRANFQGLETTAASIASATWTSLPLQTEMIDPYDGHSSNSSQYVFPETGNARYPVDDYYLCIGYVPFSSASGSSLHIAGITRSGSDLREGMKVPSGTGHAVDCIVVDIMAAKGNPFSGSGPYLELQGWQNTGAAVNTVVSSKSPSLTIRWVGCDRYFGSSSPSVPHSWIDQDEATADATGTAPTSPGVKVPLNREVASNVQFYSAPPIVRLTSEGSTQTIPSSSSSWTAIQFPTGNIVSFNGWSSSANTRFTVQVAGLYFVAGMVSLVESTGTHSGYRACRLQVNGDPNKIYGGSTTVPSSGTTTTGTAIYAIALIQLAAGDYVELQAQQTQSNAPTALSVNTSATGACRLVAVWQCL